MTLFIDLIRKMEDMLDAFADRAAKPRLYLTDKMQIALGSHIFHPTYWN